MRHPLALAVGVLLLALTVMAVQASLALAFDPRYRDFPFAPLTAAAVPFLLLGLHAPGKDAGGAEDGGGGAGAERGFRGLERNRRQLAGALVWDGGLARRLYTRSGAGRARLRQSSATAKADSTTL